MAINYVTLTGNFGAAAAGMKAVFTPSNWLQSGATNQTFPPAPVIATADSLGKWSALLLATDSSATPPGWAWTVKFIGISGVPALTQVFLLPNSGGSTQDWSDIAPVATAPATATILTSKAATANAGFSLQNGTPTILSWTTPNDGSVHRFILMGELVVTSNETGGLVNCVFTDPLLNVRTRQVWAAGLAASFNPLPAGLQFIAAPNTAVTLTQGSALTAGAATLWTEIWGL